MAKGILCYWPGILFSALIHLVLVVALAWSWRSPSTPATTTPRYINATIVELNAATVKPKVTDTINPKPIDQQRAQKAAAASAAEKEQRRQRQQQKREREKLERETAARRVKEQAQRQQLERQRGQQLAQQQAVADNLAREKERLLAEEQALTDKTISQSYSALIADRIEQNWSRPASARNNMQCELMIQMVPTGHVINVKITTGSGNAAFDRSAVQAVKKIARFREVQDMPSRIFEQYFRTFTVNFNPQDLQL
jgi:colicin import membrane protein